MAFVEDLSVFFADFGDDATLAGQPVRVIFDAPGGPVQLGEIAAAATDPQVQIQSADVPAAPFGAALVITTGRGAGSYTVREHQPDGTGMSLLLLTKA